MPRYKRTFDEMELPSSPQPEPEQVGLLQQLRSMVEFTAFAQYCFLFGEIVLRKVDADMDIEDLEAECLKTEPSDKLSDIGLALLKYVSSHRGLTPEIFDEYTRRQYLAKAPQRNPFGEEEEPNKFQDMDVFTKIKVLHQLSIWTFGNADRLRGLMPAEDDQLNWRIEPLGWDRDDRAYYVLDDNRLYRRSDEPVPPPTPKLKPKKKTAPKKKNRGTRSSKRRKIEESPEPEQAEEEEDDGLQDNKVIANGEQAQEEELGYGFTSKTWECIAVTLEEYQDFLATIFRSKDPNEKALRKQIEEGVLPIIEQRAEAQRQKQLKKLRELENLQKMATAKRSSRLADKADREKQEREEREAEERHQAEIRMAHEEQERQRKIEEGHESRRLTREQRLKEREVKRILHEEELARLEQEANRAESEDTSTPQPDTAKRISNRQLKAQREQHQRELEKMAEEEEKWIFDCAICGLHGENLDDGTHSVACERCNVWQHSKCHGFSPKQVESDEFHFVCESCKRKEEEAKKPKIAPLKLGKNRLSASPKAERIRPSSSDRPRDSGLPEHVQRQLDGDYKPPMAAQSPGPFGQLTNGPSPSYHGHAGYPYPPVSNFAPRAPSQQQWVPPPPPGQQQQAARPLSRGHISPPPIANGFGDARPHYQQHQFIHHNAMTAAGGHPPQQAQYAPRTNGYYPPSNTILPPQRAPYQVYANPPLQQTQRSPPPPQQTQRSPPPLAPSPQQPVQAPYASQCGFQNGDRRPSQPYQTSPPPQPPHWQQTPYQHQMQRPGSGHLMNGFQSPIKQPPSVSPANQPAQPSSETPRPAQSSPFMQSPYTSFPPPAPLSTQQHSQSPVKSSPPPGPSSSSRPASSQHHLPPVLQQTPRSLQPPAANGQHYTTPPMLPNPSQGSGIVADGMSGPWPAASKVIPEKHDQSPAPPPSSQAIGEKQVLPPIAALAPSPSQTASASQGSVPIKRDL